MTPNIKIIKMLFGMSLFFFLVHSLRCGSEIYILIPLQGSCGFWIKIEFFMYTSTEVTLTNVSDALQRRNSSHKLNFNIILARKDAYEHICSIDLTEIKHVCETVYSCSITNL